ncbi:platelet-derived growth factor receptor-like protein isoform X1 [Dromaius novaehollandiae]|uniref:platelet-derived growth factor receptor-like protein isoform X1 n=1 Tax=Dromaius novaehollandiae TaxID=8790 RepID=UPI00311D3498
MQCFGMTQSTIQPPRIWGAGEDGPRLELRRGKLRPDITEKTSRPRGSAAAGAARGVSQLPLSAEPRLGPTARPSRRPRRARGRSPGSSPRRPAAPSRPPARPPAAARPPPLRHAAVGAPQPAAAARDAAARIKQLDRYGQLILANSTAADTGEYSCWLQLCNGNKCRKDETKMGSTYIFFTDKGELFVPTPSYFEIVYLNPDKPAVIPCRVTTPSAKVTLHREFPAEEIETDGTNIIYDVKKGFVYHHPTSDHKGIVYCKAESQGAPQISIKYHLLYVEVPKGPPSTTITASSNRAEVSDSINVICTVLGEPDVDVNFSWQYPGQESERPVIIQNFWRLINRGTGHTTRISKSVIVIEDFEARDAGNYICIAQNLQGETTVATKVELN